MTIGVLVRLSESVKEELARVKSFGLTSCQLNSWDMEKMQDEKFVKLSREAIAQSGVKVSTVWAGWSGPAKWNFTEGPSTLGLVPVQYREQRTKDLLIGSDFAKKIGVDQIATHMGFIPETPNDPLYEPTISAIRTVAQRCKDNGQSLLFETGQETPVTLLRAITDIGTGNLGINLDPANLLMYGKANPVDALDVFGKYVMDTHCKDGEYPTDPYNLGKEVRLGDGRVNFPALINKLLDIGYTGAFTIEREISGDQQNEDIIHARDMIAEIVAKRNR